MATNGNGPSNKILLRVPVTVDDNDEIANPLRCPIANSIAIGDQDCLHTRATKEQIKFSRRSDGMRYIFNTPQDARDFINQVDNKQRPADFILTLRVKDLISMTKRQTGNIADVSKRRRSPATKVKTSRVGGDDAKVKKEVKVTPAKKKMSTSKPGSRSTRKVEPLSV